ncbi:MAG: YdcF family protein [Acidimicrobiia bacterium]
MSFDDEEYEADRDEDGEPSPWPRRDFLKPVALLAAFAVLAYTGFCFLNVWWRANNDDSPTRADALLVLGAAQYDGRPSPVFAARLDHALELYRAGVAKQIYVTGGGQPGDRFTEATAGANYLIERGVPDSAIVRETTSRDSYESLAASARILSERGQQKVVMVTDPFHAARVDAIAHELGLEASTSPTRTSPIKGGEEWRRMLGETARMGAGQILGFRRIARNGSIGSMFSGEL